MIVPEKMLHAVRSSLRFLHYVYRNFMRNRGLEVAKSLTYTSLFAVVPLLTLIFSILSAFPSFQVFGEQVQGMIYERLLPSSGTELEAYLTRFAGQARNLTWAGAVLLLITAYLMLVNVERNFNQIWGVSEQRKGVSSFLLYWSVLSLGPLLLGVGFAISSYVTSLNLFDRFSQVSDLVGARGLVLGLFPLVLTTIAFTLVYVAVPNCIVKLKHGLCGALVVALSFVLVKWVFARFIAGASYEFVYGTFAAIPIFLLWIYVCWVVILFGANLVRAIPLYGSSNASAKVHPSLLLLALLHRLWRCQQNGTVLTLSELLDRNWPFRSVSADRLISLLQELKLVHVLGDDEFALARDLEGLSFWELLRSTPWGLPAAAELEAGLPLVLAEELPGQRELAVHFRQLEYSASQEFSGTIAEHFRRYEASADSET